MALWKSLMNKANHICRLSLPDWLTLIEAWWILAFFSLTLRLVHNDRLSDVSQKNTKDSDDLSGEMIGVKRWVKLVEWASRLHLLPMTCLVKARALRKMLARRGIPAQLRIGASKIQADLHMHAWVEVDGKIISESDNPNKRFVSFRSMLN